MRGYLRTGVPDPASAIAAPSAALLKAVAISGAFPITKQEQVDADGVLSTSAIGTQPPDNLQGFGRLKLDHVLYFRDNAAKHLTFIPRVVPAPPREWHLF